MSEQGVSQRGASGNSEHAGLPPARVERTDVPILPLGLLIGGVGVLVCLLGGLVAWLYPSSLADQTIAGSLPHYPAPSLQSSPRADMARLFADQMRTLNSVGWLDRAHGVVHLPIDDAMRRVAQEGIADWPTGPVDTWPHDPTLRHGTPGSTTLEQGLQRNVVTDDLTRTPAP